MFRMTYLIKLLGFVLSLVIALQAATYVASRLVITNSVKEKARKELQTGGEVLSRIIQKNIEQLAVSVKVLTDDFGFKDAVASNDAITIESALKNHSARIRASLGIYISKEGQLVSTLDNLDQQTRERLGLLVQNAANRGMVFDTLILQEKAYQLVFSAVKAPETIGYAAMGFEINKSFSEELKNLTNLDISFIHYQNKNDMYLTGTLNEQDQTVLLNYISKYNPGTQVVTTDTYMLLQIPAAKNNADLAVILQIPLKQILQPFDQLYWQLLILAIVFSIIAGIAAWFLAKGVTQPVTSLAETAQIIAKGFYETPVKLNTQDEIGELAQAFISMQSAIREREKAITYQSLHDSLTGLPNRLQIFPVLTQRLTIAQQTSKQVAALLIDIKHFSQINDELSQEIGDLVLQETGKQLKDFAPANQCFRLGSDEFLLILEANQLDLQETANQIHHAFKQPLEQDELHLKVELNIGMALFPEHADSAESLLRRANLALQEGRHLEQQTCIYQAGWDEKHLRRILLLRDFETSLDAGHISLYYQPKIALPDEKLSSAEALVRWRHPELGFVSPDEFISIIESSGQITLLTRWVIKTAISQLASFHQQGITIDLSVNLSTLDLLSDDLPVYIHQLLQEYGVDSKHLYLEITESAIMRDADKCLTTLKELQSLGTILSIDDFGTGYSSLSQLKKLPVSELKIDKSFILNLMSNEDDQLIVRSTLELAHTMGLTVTAEGVETDAIKSQLIAWGCDTAQGYFYSKPLNQTDFIAWAKAYQQQKGKN